MPENILKNDPVLDKIHEINLNMLSELDRICKAHGITYYLCFGALLGAVRHQDFIPWDNDIDIIIKRSEFDRLLPYLYEELDPELYEVIMPDDYGKTYWDMVPRINYKKADIKMDPDFVTYYEGRLNKIAIDFFFIDKVPAGITGSLHVARLEFLYGCMNAKRYKLDTSVYHGLVKCASYVLYAIGSFLSAPSMRKHIEKLCRKYENRSDVSFYRVTNDNLHSFAQIIPESFVDGTVEQPIRDRFFPGPKDTDGILKLWYGDYMQLPPEESRIPHWGTVLITADNFTFTE